MIEVQAGTKVLATKITKIINDCPQLTNSLLTIKKAQTLAQEYHQVFYGIQWNEASAGTIKRTKKKTSQIIYQSRNQFLLGKKTFEDYILECQVSNPNTMDILVQIWTLFYQIDCYYKTYSNSNYLQLEIPIKDLPDSAT